MKKFTVLTMILAAMALLLVACGGDDNNGGNGEPTALTFEGNDSFQFVPASASVSAGNEVEVTLNNVGALEHSWTLIPDGTDVNVATNDDAINNATTGTIPAGETGSVTFTAPDAGTYQFICTVPGHAAAGMVGTLTVN